MMTTIKIDKQFLATRIRLRIAELLEEQNKFECECVERTREFIEKYCKNLKEIYTESVDHTNFFGFKTKRDVYQSVIGYDIKTIAHLCRYNFLEYRQYEDGDFFYYNHILNTLFHKEYKRDTIYTYCVKYIHARNTLDKFSKHYIDSFQHKRDDLYSFLNFINISNTQTIDLSYDDVKRLSLNLEKLYEYR